MAKAIFTILGESTSQSNNDRREIGLRSSARKRCAGISREAEFCGEPAKSMPFDLVPRGRRSPIRQLGVVHGHKCLCHYRRKRDTRVEETEIARMRHLDLPSSQHLFYICDSLLQGHWLLEVVARREVASNLFRRHTGDYGARCDL